MFPTGSVDQSGLPRGGPSPQVSCHVEADHGHLLAEVISCTRAAVCLDSLPDRTSGRPPDLAGGLPPTGLEGVRFCMISPSIRLPQFAGGDWMDPFDHEDEVAYAITSGTVARADADSLKPLPRGRSRAPPWET